MIVSGGRNDATDLASTADDAAKQLSRTLRRRLPHAVLIAVAPMWGDRDLPPQMVALGAAVRSAVTAAGGSYLAVADPIHGHPGEMADPADPNDAGYAAITSALAPLLSPLVTR